MFSDRQVGIQFPVQLENIRPRGKVLPHAIRAHPVQLAPTMLWQGKQPHPYVRRAHLERTAILVQGKFLLRHASNAQLRNLGVVQGQRHVPKLLVVLVTS